MANFKEPVHLNKVIRSLEAKYAKLSYDKSPGLDWYHKPSLGSYYESMNCNWTKDKNSSYLISLLHQVYQTSFIVTAGIQTVQEARVNVLSTEMGVA